MSELIDRQALLDECLNHYEVGNIEQNCTMDWICKTVRNFPAASPWHRVEEELPNFSGKVLVNIKPVVSCDSDRFETAYYNCLMSGDIDPKTFWQYDYEKDCIVDITKYVTHWMAVEPPKEEN